MKLDVLTSMPFPSAITWRRIRSTISMIDPFIDGSSHISDTGSLDVPAISLDEDITEMVDQLAL